MMTREESMTKVSAKDIEAYIDKQSTPEQAIKVEQALFTDEGVRDKFLQILEQDRLLRKWWASETRN